MARVLKLLEFSAEILGNASLNSSVMGPLAPSGNDNQYIVNERFEKVWIGCRSSQPGTIFVWQGVQLADMPDVGAPTIANLMEQRIDYQVEDSMSFFEVEPIFLPFLQVRYTNSAAGAAMRLYIVAYADSHK